MDEIAKRILHDVNLDEVAPRVKDRSPVDHWSSPILLERAAYLRKLAKYGNGSASETIREYPLYSAELSFCERTGDAEVHCSHSSLFHVLAGAATLMIGGTLNRPRSAGAGEVRGDSTEHGSPQDLRQGDVVHIPAGVPHQILVAGDKSITCLVVRIRVAQ